MVDYYQRYCGRMVFCLLIIMVTTSDQLPSRGGPSSIPLPRESFYQHSGGDLHHPFDTAQQLMIRITCCLYAIRNPPEMLGSVQARLTNLVMSTIVMW